MTFHTSTLPNQQQCIELFQRLKALHDSLKTLDIDIKGRTLGIDVEGRADLASSGETYQLLEAHVTEDGDSSRTDPDSTNPQVPVQSRYIDSSAQAAISVANDVRNIQLSRLAWDEIPDYYLGPTEGEEGEIVNLREIIWSLPDEPEEVDDSEKLDRLWSWREDCGYIQPPHSSWDDNFHDAVPSDLPSRSTMTDGKEKVGPLEPRGVGNTFEECPFTQYFD